MGTMQRNKGKKYERQIATHFRKRYPKAVVRRTTQSQRAWNSDVVIEGNAHEVLRALWIECNDEKDPNPLVKLAQAERDIERVKKEGRLNTPVGGTFYRIPIVVWHKIRARKHWVTLRVRDLQALIGEEVECRAGAVVLTIDLNDFLNEVLP